MTSFPDLDHPAEIEDLVRILDQGVGVDEVLGPFFVDQANVDWEEHIPKITAFWCTLELGIPGYRRASAQEHSALSSTVPFRAEQFSRWVELFHDTVDRGWRGPHASSIKERAVLIARMQSRLVEGAEAWDAE